MAQTTIHIQVDAELKEDFERLCHDIGMDMTTAFTVFMKQCVRKNKLFLDLSSEAFYSKANRMYLERSIE